MQKYVKKGKNRIIFGEMNRAKIEKFMEFIANC